MGKFAVMGSPIAHSYSPTLHRAAFAHLGVDADYQAEDIKSLDSVDFDNYLGLSLTMPLKLDAFELADTHDDESLATGVSNTLLISNGYKTALNTDVYGIAKSVENLDCATVQIVGTGATAKSAALALRERKIFFHGRNPEKIQMITDWAESQSIEITNKQSVDLVIDTTPGETYLEYVRHSYVLDVAYVSDRNAGASGLISGLEMLLHQAVLQNISFSSPFVSEKIDALTLTEVMRRALAERVGEWSNA